MLMRKTDILAKALGVEQEVKVVIREKQQEKERKDVKGGVQGVLDMFRDINESKKKGAEREQRMDGEDTHMEDVGEVAERTQRPSDDEELSGDTHIKYARRLSDDEEFGGHTQSEHTQRQFDNEELGGYTQGGYTQRQFNDEELGGHTQGGHTQRRFNDEELGGHTQRPSDDEEWDGDTESASGGMVNEVSAHEKMLREAGVQTYDFAVRFFTAKRRADIEEEDGYRGDTDTGHVSKKHATLRKKMQLQCSGFVDSYSNRGFNRKKK